MKNLGIALGITLASFSAQAKELPPVPENCASDIEIQGFCTDYDAPLVRGPVTIRFFIAVEQEDFPTYQDAVNRYLDFNSWPQYLEQSGTDRVVFFESSLLEPLDSAPEVFRHYSNYKMNAPVVGWQYIRVVLHNKEVEPYEGAIASLEFHAQKDKSFPQPGIPAAEKPLYGTEGLKDQVGTVHIADCTESELCLDGQWLLIYESTIAPDIDLLPRVAAGVIQEGIEGILSGMFLNGVEE